MRAYRSGISLVELSKRLRPGLVFHGTTHGSAKQIARSGIRESPDGALGRGVYTGNMRTANAYGSSYIPVMGHGKQTGKRTGKVIGFKPKGKPLATGKGMGSSLGQGEATWKPSQLGKPVHIQNVNRTSAQRAQARRMGVPKLPKTGPAPQAPTPVSQLTRDQIRQRKAAVALRRLRNDPDEF